MVLNGECVQVYPFLFRCISGEWKDAVRLEMKRVRREHPNAPQWQQVLHSRYAHLLTCCIILCAVMGIMLLLGVVRGHNREIPARLTVTDAVYLFYSFPLTPLEV